MTVRSGEFPPTGDGTLISVIMPAYNVEAFVEEAARSVLQQDWRNLELIAIDDGSRDATAERLAALAAEPLPSGKALRLIRQANAGAAAARNAGLAAARGEIYAFMDADDRWHPTLASKLMATLAADPAADLTFPLFRYIDEAGNATGTESRVVARRFDAVDLLVANPIHSATGVMVRRTAAEGAGRFDERLTSCIDLDYFVRVGRLRRSSIVATPVVLADYRRRSGQITGDWRRMRENWRCVVEKSLAAGIEIPPNRLGEARARWDLYCATVAYNSGDHRAARRLVASVWRMSPRFAAADPHARIRSLACLATLLPLPLHDRLRTAVNAIRTRLGLDWS